MFCDEDQSSETEEQRDSRQRMTQIRWECPNRTLHDSYLLDFPANRRGFSRDSYDVVRKHRRSKVDRARPRNAQLWPALDSCVRPPDGASRGPRPLHLSLQRAGASTLILVLHVQAARRYARQEAPGTSSQAPARPNAARARSGSEPLEPSQRRSTVRKENDQAETGRRSKPVPGRRGRG